MSATRTRVAKKLHYAAFENNVALAQERLAAGDGPNLGDRQGSLRCILPPSNGSWMSRNVCSMAEER